MHLAIYKVKALSIEKVSDQVRFSKWNYFFLLILILANVVETIRQYNTGAVHYFYKENAFFMTIITCMEFCEIPN